MRARARFRWRIHGPPRKRGGVLHPSTVPWTLAQYRAETPILAGVTATTGGIVVTGDMNRTLLVLDARTGRLVHSAATGAAIGAGIVTYSVRGRQYIAAAGGTISPIWPLPEATSRVTVFSL